MSDDRITTAAELDALPVGSVVRCDDDEGIGLNVCERHPKGWQYVGSALHFTSAQVASDQMEFTVLYRPDRPALETYLKPDVSSSPDRPTPGVLPSRVAIADALIQARSSGMCHFGKVCDLCDCGLDGHSDEEAARADARTLIEADAVLALLPGRSEREVLAQGWDEGYMAGVIDYRRNKWLPTDTGSKRNLGRHSIEANPNLAPWRADAIWRLQKAMQEQMVVQFTGPVEVVATFVYARPRSHYGTGKNANKVKAGAPMWKTSAADLDKLQRAVGDALTQAGVLRDDALIVHWDARKLWGPAGSVELIVRGVE